MVALVDHFFRPGTRRGDPLRSGRGDDRLSSAGWDHKVDSPSLEMERAWNATHSAVAFSRPATASHTDSGMSGEQAVKVKCRMRCQPPGVDGASGRHADTLWRHPVELRAGHVPRVDHGGGAHELEDVARFQHHEPPRHGDRDVGRDRSGPDRRHQRPSVNLQRQRHATERLEREVLDDGGGAGGAGVQRRGRGGVVAAERQFLGADRQDQVSRAVAPAPRRRWTSKASSSHPLSTSLKASSTLDVRSVVGL